MLVPALALLTGLSVSVAAYAFTEARRLTFTFVRRVAPELSRAHRLLLMSDLHLTAREGMRYGLIQRAAVWGRSHGAEATLLAGDLLESDRDARAVARLLRRSLGEMRAITVTGNHEYGGPPQLRVEIGPRRNDIGAIYRAFAQEGFESADDRVLEVGEVNVVGTRWTAWKLGPSRRARDLLERTSAPILLLAHSPDQVVGAAAEGVRLAVCGHTHGGQIRFPIVGALVTQTRTKLPAPAGAMVLAGVPTYVTRGVGHGIPFRLMSPPEAALLELAPDRSSEPPRNATVVEME